MTHAPKEQTLKKPEIPDPQDEQRKKIDAFRAAQRLKLTPEEAKKRADLSMLRFKRFELISVIVLLIVSIALSFLVFEAAKPGAENEAILNATILIWAAVTVHSAIVIRTSFVRMMRDDRISDEAAGHPFKGWRFTYFTPLIATIVLIPAISAGIYNFEGGNALQSFITLLALFFVALLMGALVAAFVIAPIEALVRGFIALARGDKNKTGSIYFGIFGLSLLSIIILGTMAVDPNAPYPGGSFQVLLAFLGLPGSYTIQSEPMLWAVRILVAAIVVAFVWSSWSDKKAKAANKSETTK